MDFPRLAVFAAVARNLSFSKAADDLHLSQPAVSKHIRLLEAELGTTLFHRLGNRVELTDAGHIVQDYAQRISILTEETRRVLGELQGLQRGYLRVGASSTPGLYLLPETVAQFQQEHPQVEVALMITNSAGVSYQLLHGEIDIGFVGLPPQNVVGLQVRPFAADEIVLIVPPGHVLAQQRVWTPATFAKETLIVRESGSGTRQVVEAEIARLGLRPARVMELAGCEAVKRAVAAGLGLAFVSRRTVTLEAAHGLVHLPEIADLRFQRQLYVLTRKDARLPAAALAFLALAVKRENAARANPSIPNAPPPARPLR
jgi:DNA-binding transcriptional LysR family regulator